jgi:hypothetical protein
MATDIDTRLTSSVVISEADMDPPGCVKGGIYASPQTFVKRRACLVEEARSENGGEARDKREWYFEAAKRSPHEVPSLISDTYPSSGDKSRREGRSCPNIVALTKKALSARRGYFDQATSR